MIQVLFFFFAAIAAGAAINVLAQRHVLYSALSLILMLTAVSVLFILLLADFLAVIQVVVYAGAIMVLFVFVIMLLNAGAEERTEGSRIALWIGGPGVAVLTGLIVWTMVRNNPSFHGVLIGNMVDPKSDNTHGIANLLFRDFLLPFEITSVLILIAIMGAVVLAGRRTS